MSEKMRVGLIGVGLMGHGMGKNVVEKGFPLTVLAHRNREPIEDLLKRGASEAANAKEVAENSDMVILCVTGSPQVEDTLYRAGGLLEGLHPGMVIADATTAQPSSTAKVAADVDARGGRFVAIPMTRTPKEAEEGKLALMTGGDPAVLEEIRPVLECFADMIVHAGAPAAAHSLKLVNNFLALGNAVLISEGIAAAAKGGVDMEALKEVVMGGGGRSVMFERFMKLVLEGDDTALKFVIRNGQKDLRYYTDMAHDLPSTAFMAEAAHQHLTLANNLGHGDKFMPRMVSFLAEINGTKAGKA